MKLLNFAHKLHASAYSAVQVECSRLHGHFDHFFFIINHLMNSCFLTRGLIVSMRTHALDSRQLSLFVDDGLPATTTLFTSRHFRLFLTHTDDHLCWRGGVRRHRRNWRFLRKGHRLLVSILEILRAGSILAILVTATSRTGAAVLGRSFGRTMARGVLAELSGTW